MEAPKTRRENEIWQACDDLWALHASTGKLTGDAIRDKLLTLGYKKGSPNEVYKFRRTWKLSRGVAANPDETQDTMQNDPISRAVSMVYEQIHANAQSELDTLRADFDASLEQLSAARDEALAKLMALDEQLQGTRAELDHVTGERATFEQNLQHQSLALALLQERHETSVRLHDEARRDQNTLVAELKRVQEREIDLWRSQLKERGQAWSDESTTLRVQLRELSKERDGLANEQAALRKRLSQQDEQLKSAKQENTRTSKENQRLRLALKKTETKLSAALARAGTLAEIKKLLRPTKPVRKARHVADSASKQP